MVLSSRHSYLVTLVYLFIAGATSQEAICGQEDYSPFADKIHLLLFQRDNTNPSMPQITSRDVFDAIDDIDPSKPSMVYIHGYMENPALSNVRIVPEAYLERGEKNVLVLDWSEVASSLIYASVAKKVPAVGKALADYLTKLGDLVDANRLEVVGHSLGAQVAGYTGRSLNDTVLQIIGLDPAFPQFYPSPCHVRPSDAAIVVILHTDGGFYGTPVNTGTVDFYANNGISPQPGCPLVIGAEICSHQRSVTLFAESVRNPKAFPARKCLYSSDVIYFGDSTPKEACGAYCFTTNSQPPYGTGAAA